MDNNQGSRQFFQEYPCSQQLLFSGDLKEKDKSFVIMEGEIYDANNSRTASSSIGEDSSALNGSLTSLDTEDDASSASANSSSSLFDLTDLIPQLPVK